MDGLDRRHLVLGTACKPTPPGAFRARESVSVLILTVAQGAR